jgi:hypothetical protein
MADHGDREPRAPHRSGIPAFDGAFLLNPPSIRPLGAVAATTEPLGSVGGSAPDQVSGAGRQDRSEGGAEAPAGRALLALAGPVLLGLTSGWVVAGLDDLSFDHRTPRPGSMLVVVVLIVLAAANVLAVDRKERRRLVLALLWSFLIGFWPVPLVGMSMLLALLLVAS